MKGKSTLHPLTEEQKQFATENHSLVYKFLKQNGYSIETFYDVVIMRYLLACQVYLENRDLKKLPFSAIAYNHMRSAIGNYYKNLNTQKRTADAISLDSFEDDKTAELKDNAILPLLENIVHQELMKNIFGNLTERQGRIVICLLAGYENSEAYMILKIKKSSYYRELRRIRVSLENNLKSEGELI